jgi:hypothetical protein
VVNRRRNGKKKHQVFRQKIPWQDNAQETIELGRKQRSSGGDARPEAQRQERKTGNRDRTLARAPCRQRCSASQGGQNLSGNAQESAGRCPGRHEKASGKENSIKADDEEPHRKENCSENDVPQEDCSP